MGLHPHPRLVRQHIRTLHRHGSSLFVYWQGHRVYGHESAHDTFHPYGKWGRAYLAACAGEVLRRK